MSEVKMGEITYDTSAPIRFTDPYPLRNICTDMAFTFSNPTEWAHVDKDLNVTFLDMKICAAGPHNPYTALALAVRKQALLEAAENCFNLATGDECARMIKRMADAS